MVFSLLVNIANDTYQGRSQQEARDNPPDFVAAPLNWFCPYHGRSLHLAMGQLPFKITIMPVSLASHIIPIN